MNELHLVERGGGSLPKSKGFGTLFAKILGELGCTKVFQKFQNNIHIKADFFWGKLPYSINGDQLRTFEEEKKSGYLAV